MKGGVSAWVGVPFVGKIWSSEHAMVDLGGGAGQTVRGSFQLSK